jgi:myo-inositol-1(or 4)-monophosphatase
MNNQFLESISDLVFIKRMQGIVVDFHGNDFTGMSSEPYLIACHPDNKEYFLNMVNES